MLVEVAETARSEQTQGQGAALVVVVATAKAQGQGWDTQGLQQQYRATLQWWCTG